MAYAIVPSIDIKPGAGGFQMSFDILFAGAGVPNGSDYTKASVTILAGDSLPTVRTKFNDAILAEASRLGYPLSLANVFMPSFQKGA